MKRLLATLVLVLASTVSLDAHAQADLQAKFEQAQQLYDKLNYKEALPLFEAAYQGTGSPNASLYMGRCLRELGRLDEAYVVLRETRRLAAERATKEKRFVETRDAAIVELKELEAHVGRLYVTLTNPPEGATVSIAGKTIPAERFARIDESGNAVEGQDPLPLVLMSGRVRLEVSAPGYESVAQELQLSGGPPERVTLPALVAGASTTVSAPPPVLDQPDAPDESADGDTQRLVGLGGVGVVGLGVGTVFGIMALGTSSDADALCNGAECSAEGLAMHDDANGQANVSNVSIVAGLALVAVGAVVYLSADDERGEDTVGVLRGLDGGVHTGGGWLGWRQSW